MEENWFWLLFIIEDSSGVLGFPRSLISGTSQETIGTSVIIVFLDQQCLFFFFFNMVYSCLENLMDRGAWWATVHGVIKSWTRLKWLSEIHSVMSNSLWPPGLYSPRNSPGQNTGVGSLSLLQEIFPTQGSNPDLPHCRQILYHLSHRWSPKWLSTHAKIAQAS